VKNQNIFFNWLAALYAEAIYFERATWVRNMNSLH